MGEFNITDIALKTNAENIAQCHAITAVPSVLITSLAFIVFFLIFSFFIVKQDRPTMLKILGFTFAFAGTIAGAVIFLPNLVQNVVGFFT